MASTQPKTKNELLVERPCEVAVSRGHERFAELVVFTCAHGAWAVTPGETCARPWPSRP